ncbi:zinc metallochaperone AztD [Nocardioides sp. AE5]|uniref:zinc metallochaperone AztD n=1 Tax=Nocardioides sp. AE5 TaxID=2962573 RepID=UPI002881B9B6|nr:zinc metallochaperone AztD [Nocardioides sp. AE5]MDT0202436.1 zinc metallochaperone AztD [Nocardioides sp. AE5]
MIPIALAAFLMLTGCGQHTGEEADPGSTGAHADHDDHDHDEEGHADEAATETDGPEARLALTYDGGVLVLRAADGEVLLDHAAEGFIRVNPAGDERHVFLSTSKGWEALDLGAWTQAHGDHGHSFVGEPHLTGTVIEGQEPGHVVAHGGRTVLFDDGTGGYTVLDPHDLAEEDPELTEHATDEAHHGVAVALPNGNLLHTVGTSDARNGVRLVTAAGHELAATSDCPGVHGEAFAGEVAGFGCEDGVVLVDGRTITKAQSPDAYGRIGNLAGHEESPVLLGDYKSDPDAELERPTRIALIDTRTARVQLVDVDASYSFRSLGRGPGGEALVLGTDGNLRVIDPESGQVTVTIPVTAEWTEPEQWQQPRPALAVLDGTAYVTEPATRQVHVVDLAAGKVTGSHDLPQVPNEIVGVTG